MEKTKELQRSKYFAYLSDLTVEELRNIVEESNIHEYSHYERDDLIKLIDQYCVNVDDDWYYIDELDYLVKDITHELVKKCVEKRMFPDAMKAWVDLFAPNKSVSEHYAQVILDVLSPMSVFEEKSNEEYIRYPLFRGIKYPGHAITFRKTKDWIGFYDDIMDESMYSVWRPSDDSDSDEDLPDGW
jgi:hypothetical protein